MTISGESNAAFLILFPSVALNTASISSSGCAFRFRLGGGGGEVFVNFGGEGSEVAVLAWS